MDPILTAGALFKVHQHRLALTWVAAQAGQDRPLQAQDKSAAAVLPLGAWIGHLNLIHPNRIQVLGASELHYLSALGKNSHQDALQQLFAKHPAAVIVADDAPLSEELRRQAEESATPLWTSPLQSHKIVNYLQYHISTHLADKITLHGVFMEILGMGVLITGESGIGKSELALELISRGHRLIADDSPEFFRNAPDILTGYCPVALREFLEVQGLGLLNIREMFGDSVVKPSKNLRLIIHLERMDSEALRAIDRLHGSRQLQVLLEVEIPQVTLPVAPGRNMAVLAEGAARNHILNLRGYDAAEVFVRQQRQLIDEVGS